MGGVCSCSFLQHTWLAKEKKRIKGIMLGYYAVGKTTLLYNMKNGILVSSSPTVGYNVESIELDKYQLDL